MAPQGAMRTYILFLLMLAPSALLGYTVSERYQKFINQHVKRDMSRALCDRVIYDRSITTNGACKPSNTFIMANIDQIKPVCNRAGTPYQNSATLRKSNQPFPIVTCRQRNTQPYPNCQYNGVHHATVYIVIACQQGLPVHYERYEP